jgi:hypothetical protein
MQDLAGQSLRLFMLLFSLPVVLQGCNRGQSLVFQRDGVSLAGYQIGDREIAVACIAVSSAKPRLFLIVPSSGQAVLFDFDRQETVSIIPVSCLMRIGQGFSLELGDALPVPARVRSDIIRPGSSFKIGFLYSGMQYTIWIMEMGDSIKELERLRRGE